MKRRSRRAGTFQAQEGEGQTCHQERQAHREKQEQAAENAKGVSQAVMER